ncbi:phage-like protein [Gottschalkia purinilytica]|uniref:Phage-like protein n=2 Tax=Gottschalkia purinilytica TaxID=1503 RepID=A0A0L0WCV0_GOTPU|nr:phage-like protein [Gottschalkia purinilytica]
MLKCPFTEENRQLLKEGNIIWKKDDLEAGVIETKSVLGEDITVSGPFLTSYLGRRIIWGTFYAENYTFEHLMRIMVNTNCINVVPSDRVIPYLKLGRLNFFKETTSYQASYKNILTELEEISNKSGLGYRVEFNPFDKQLLFQVYQGLDRTEGQKVNSPCIFSQEFENVMEQDYTKSLTDYRNVALIGGQGEGMNRKLVDIGLYSGLERYEMFVDARDIQDKVQNESGEEKNLTEEEVKNLLIERGKQKLAECKKIESFNSVINLNSNLEYKKDFDLGDIVTMSSQRLRVILSTRITEIEEVYTRNETNINIVFGNDVPSFKDKIRVIQYRW